MLFDFCGVLDLEVLDSLPVINVVYFIQDQTRDVVLVSRQVEVVQAVRVHHVICVGQPSAVIFVDEIRNYVA